MTHPAFLAFDTDSSITKGIWVGKFETGYKEATSEAGAQQNPNNGMNGTPDKVIIKPNVYSWRGIQIANAYWTSYNYKREYDSHMMKNTEWGAIAYLQHSKYGSGKYASTSESAKASVRINNNSNYKTGYAGVHEPTKGLSETSVSCTSNPNSCNEFGTSESVTKSWNTSTGYLSSTTGNISGVYDMSGGASEYLMGIMMHKSGETCSGRDGTANSGFNGIFCFENGRLTNGVTNFPTEKKYYDEYIYKISSYDYDVRILGDATGEMGPFLFVSQYIYIGSWYQDDARIVYSYSPWITRGGVFKNGTGAGIFSMGCESGISNIDKSFRIVLSI